MPSLGKRWMFRGIAAAALAVASTGSPIAQQERGPVPPSAEAPYRALVNTYCLSCHNGKSKAGGLELDTINTTDLREHSESWEKVVRKLRSRQMPPPGSRLPNEAARTSALHALETSLDRLAVSAPNPGRTDTFRRLNRTEYRNAIRDLLAVEIDAASLLPSDSASYGFDNVTVGNLSPTLLESYVSAAEKISQLVVGRPSLSPGGSTVRLRPDLTQESHVDGLPIGTRGGALVSHEFPANGEYEITIRLARDRNEHIEGLLEPHDVELLLDGERVRLFTVAPVPPRTGQSSAESASHANLDSHMKIRVPVTAGPHVLGVTFPEEAVAAARDGASAVRSALQLLSASSTSAGGLRSLDRRSVQCRWSGRHSQPRPRVHVPSRPCAGRRQLRQTDTVDADAARLSPARHRC